MINMKIFKCLRFVLVAAILPTYSIGEPIDEKSDISCAFFSTDPNATSGPPIHFYADMSAHDQHAPTESPGIAQAEFVLYRDTLELSWKISYRDLTSSPVAIHLHGPVAPATEAPIMFGLAADDFESPIEGSRVITIGEVSQLVRNLTYVNLHTTEYPKGELRGSLKKQRPKC